MGQVGNQSSNFILRLLLFQWVLVLAYICIVAWGSQVHTMSRVITIFGHRCFGPLAVCISCQQYGVCFFHFFFKICCSALLWRKSVGDDQSTC